MKLYDFYVKPEFSEGKSSMLDFAKRAKILGYSGICISHPFENLKNIEEIKEEFKKVEKETGVRIFMGFEASSPQELQKLTKIRREYDVLFVKGGDISLNRKAVETPEVDVLLHPELGRLDSGLNHIMAKLANKNNVAIEVDFREILLSSKNTRSHILSKISDNIRLSIKYRVPLIICSGACSH